MAAPEAAAELGSPTPAVVTFGRSTYVGAWLANALSSSGRWAVTVVDPAPSTAHDAENAAAYYQSDFSSPAQLLRALAGVAVVFHVDPVAAAAGDFAAGHALAVAGTRNLIIACREAGVKIIIYTGSADVVVGTEGDFKEVDESAPYPDEFMDEINRLRVQVEAAILSANRLDGLLTCVLRPNGVFGPREPYLVPFIAKLARSALSKFIIGSGNIMCDFTYVDNVVHANMCAYQALCSNAEFVAGKAFFVTNHDPIVTSEFVSVIRESLGYHRPTICLPAQFFSLSGMVCKKLGLHCVTAQLLSSPLIHYLSQTRTYSSSRARDILGYSPNITLEDGIRRTVESFPELEDRLGLLRKIDVSKISKVEVLLGSGFASDILLWRDDKQTFLYVSLLLLVYYWFLLSERTFVSSAGSFLMLMLAALVLPGILPPTIFGFAVGRLKTNHFEVSESAVRNIFLYAGNLWNQGCRLLNSIARGDDWNLFIKVITALLLLKVLLCFSLTAVIGFCLACVFIVFIVYEQYEEEVDRNLSIATLKFKDFKSSVLAYLPTT